MQNLNAADIDAIAARVVASLQPAANAAPQPGPKPARDLPTNIEGRPEFSNVILTLDHLQDAHGDDGHIRNKMVFSTESTAEVIAKLVAYYRVPLTANGFARVLEITGKAAETEYNGGILVCYFPDGNPHDERGPVIEVVLSTVTYDGLVMHPDFGKGSSLLASDALVTAVGAAIARQKDQAGFVPLLTYLQISQADFPAEDAVDVKPFGAPNGVDFSGNGEVFSEARAEGSFAGSPHGDPSAGNEFTGGQAFTG